MGTHANPCRLTVDTGTETLVQPDMLGTTRVQDAPDGVWRDWALCAAQGPSGCSYRRGQRCGAAAGVRRQLGRTMSAETRLPDAEQGLC